MLTSFWLTINIESTNLTITFPEKPSIEEKIIDTNIGEVKNTNYRFADIDNINFLYSLNVLAYDSSIIVNGDSTDTDLLLDFIDNIEYDLKGKKVYASEADFYGYSGKIYRIAYDSGNLVCKGKIILFDDKILSLQVFTKKENSLNEEMDLFLNSLKQKI
jgi:hypothetical protein